MAINLKATTPLIFFGTSDFSLTVLTGLVEASHEIVAVITKPDSKSGRGHIFTPPAVKVFAERNNIPVWQPEKLSDINNDILALGSPAGILASYGKIVPQSIIDLFDPGIINIHPSLLPLYRGPSPIEAAIMSGDDNTGVSIMQLTARMDAGPVYTAKTHPLSGTETKPELYRTLAQLGTNLLLETLPLILNGSLSPIPQIEEEATYTPLLNKTDALLEPESLSAAEAERRIRAHLGFPKTKVAINGHTVIITGAHTSPHGDTPLDIICGDGLYLSIDTLVAPAADKWLQSNLSVVILRTKDSIAISHDFLLDIVQHKPDDLTVIRPVKT